MHKISEQGLLEVLADFDEFGGASLGLVAWELFVSEPQVAVAWEKAVTAGWLKPAAPDRHTNEQLWRLTASGWRAARRVPGPKDDSDPPKSAI